MNIGVFFGSSSPEHDVFDHHGGAHYLGPQKLGFQITPVYITREGKWMLGTELGS